MKKLIKNVSGCLVVVSSLFIMACEQSADVASASGINADDSLAIINAKAGPTVAFTTDSLAVYKDDTFSLDITMSDLESASEGGGVSLRFDASMLQVVSVSVDSDTWGFKNKDGFINNAEGSVSDILFSSYQGVMGDAVIATIEFKSIEKGESDITLQESAANLFASNGEKVAVVFNATTVTVN